MSVARSWPGSRSRIAILAAAAIVLGAAPSAGATGQPPDSSTGASAFASRTARAVHHDTSEPLRDIETAPAADRFTKKKRDQGILPLDLAPFAPDGITQTEVGTAATAAVESSFDGIGVGLADYVVRWAPPDTAGAVGPAHFVEVVNTDLAIFAKDGSLVYGPAGTNTLWTGFGGACESRNDGDGTVEYDALAGRWVISQFAVGGPPYYQCVAISATGDPTGAYHRYAFVYQDFPDYPKLGVWPDAYYTTFNLFRTGFVGALVCAYERAAMLDGLAAREQCVNLGVAYHSLLPADLDGSTPPPAGAPNYLLNYGSSSLRLWKFDVDWVTPASTRLIGPTSIPVASFAAACSGGTCIPQPGTSQQLASLGDRLMYRLAYRNFGSHESLVVNHSIRTGTLGTGPSGIRWYEVRAPGATPVVHQQGTYAPDSTYRWMGSAAMDGAGNLAVGYSVSSASVKPGLRWTGRLAADPLGSLPQGEATIVDGQGVQLTGLARWGDYTALSVDPADDCTFWYVGQYLKADGTWNWSTRIASFRLTGCAPATPDFTIAASPASRSVIQGSGTSYAISVSRSGDFAEAVDLSVAGLPAGATGVFDPDPAGDSSTLSVTTSAATPAGTYPLEISATGGGLSRTTTVSLVVEPPVTPSFSLAVTPTSRTVRPNASTTFTIAINRVGGFTAGVTLSASGVPAGGSASFTPNPAGGTSSVLSVRAGSGKGTFTLTISGTGGGLTRTTTAVLKVNGK